MYKLIAQGLRGFGNWMGRPAVGCVDGLEVLWGQEPSLKKDDIVHLSLVGRGTIGRCRRIQDYFSQGSDRRCKQPTAVKPRAHRITHSPGAIEIERCEFQLYIRVAQNKLRTGICLGGSCASVHQSNIYQLINQLSSGYCRRWPCALFWILDQRYSIRLYWAFLQWMRPNCEHKTGRSMPPGKDSRMMIPK